jgi:hypothetical protein
MNASSAKRISIRSASLAVSAAALVLYATLAGSCSAGGAGEQTTQAAAQPAPSTARHQRGRTMVDAKPLSLNAMVQRAERILVGTVKDIRIANEQLSEQGQTETAEVRTVTVDVTEGIKGVETGATLVVKQLNAVSAPLVQGEQVMWFLPAPSNLGLTQPLGVYSGDFRVEQTPSGRLVQNLRANEGLWVGQVWDDGFNRSDVMAAARIQKLPEARIQALEKAGSADPAEQRVPLDLLVVLTRSVVKQ